MKCDVASVAVTSHFVTTCDEWRGVASRCSGRSVSQHSSLQVSEIDWSRTFQFRVSLDRFFLTCLLFLLAALISNDCRFCVTSLPVPSSRWVWSTFSSHSPLSSKYIRWLTTASLTIFFSVIFLGDDGNQTRGSGVQKQVCWPLFYAALITNDCLYTDQKSYNYKFSASELQRDSENKSCSITINASIY